MTNRSRTSVASFRAEFRNFLRFVRQPVLAPRLPSSRSGNGWLADWLTPLPLGRLLQWALCLWAVNVLVLGPIAVAAALAGGAEHRLDIGNIPWLHALIWAPLVEELVFRYGLRQPRTAVLVFPVAVVGMLFGPAPWTLAIVAGVLLLCFWRALQGSAPARPQLSFEARRFWQRHFGLIVHVSCLAFAAVHLHNFVLNQMPFWLMPLLVLPQWATGLVLAWLRVRRGIGAAIALHAIFNGGPLLVVFVFLVLSGGSAVM